MPDLRAIVAELRGVECRCGARKGSMKSFCYACWKRLPGELGSNLYRTVGEGYEEAYREAAAFLFDEEDKG